MVHSICESFWMTAKRLVYLSLGYLRLDLASSTLFTGERQRMRLARAVRNRNMVAYGIGFPGKLVLMG